MREMVGDLWKIPADFRCVTTNGFVKLNGMAVMGRGCAYEAAQRYPKLPSQLGRMLKREGNQLYVFPEYQVITFPVKHKWWEKASMDLIAASVRQLRSLMDGLKSEVEILLPRPGCGNGQLLWENVKPLVEDLPDNVIIVSKE